MYTDFHLHFSNQFKPQNKCLVSCYNSLQYNELSNCLTNFSDSKENNVKICFGVHPLYPSQEDLLFLEKLLSNNKIDAIGEIGFDFYKQNDETACKSQLEYWNAQIELAQKYQKPIVVHSVKATEILLFQVTKLQKVPAVIFHGSKIPLSESKHLLQSRVNAFFSFGKDLILNRKLATECVKKLPLHRICLETDSPFQLKASEISQVYKKVAIIKDINETKLSENLMKTFDNLFGQQS